MPKLNSYLDNRTDWKQVWEQKSAQNVSNFDLDRGHPPDQESERLAEDELINFIEPRQFETILDAGCGTGVNIARFHTRCRNLIAIDYAWGSVERCQKRTQLDEVGNAQLAVASVTRLPLPPHCVSKVLCLSVLQYLEDREVRETLREFVRVLRPGGLIILHVKNLSSIYWSTLRLAKKAKSFLRRSTRIEAFRSFKWYINELTALNCTVLDYYSTNILMFDLMPRKCVSILRRFELRHHNHPWFRSGFLRRHGAELIIKAKVSEAS